MCTCKYVSSVLDFLPIYVTTDYCIVFSELYRSFHSCCPVPKLYLPLCDPRDCGTPGFPVLHYLPEFAQTHVHQVGDAIQPPHPLLPPFSFCLQSFPASGSFPKSWLFISGVQRFSLVFSFIYSRVFMSIPVSQFILPPTFPPCCPHTFSLHLCLYTISLYSTYMC